jgi:hypothetical protein
MKGIDTSGLKVAAPGTSFNPLEVERQEVLAVAHKILEAEDEATRRVHRHLRGDFSDDDEPVAPPPPELSEDDVPAPKTASRPLTSKDRNKAKRRQMNLEAQRAKAAPKAVNKQIDQLPEIISSIDEEERKILGRPKADIVRAPRLGKFKHTPHIPEALLSDELGTGSLREIKASINVLSDQLQRFQHKNMIETRIKTKAKRHDRKGWSKLYDAVKDADVDASLASNYLKENGWK